MGLVIDVLLMKVERAWRQPKCKEAVTIVRQARTRPSMSEKLSCATCEEWLC